MTFKEFDSKDLSLLKNVELNFGVEWIFFGFGDKLPYLLECFYNANVFKVCSYVIFKNAYDSCSCKGTHPKYSFAILRYPIYDMYLIV